MVVHIVKNQADFEKKISQAGNKLVVIDFYATWCGPCKTMDPIVQSLSRKYGSKAIFMKVNVDKFDEICDKYRISPIPTFVFVKNKKRVSSFSGADDEKLEKSLARLTKNI